MQRQSVLLVGGLVLGLLGGSLVFAYVRNLESRAEAEGEPIRVLVAEETIAAGTSGSAIADLVRTIEVPRRYAAPGAVTDLKRVADQWTVEQIEAGETITASQFAEAGSTAGRLPIPEGEEAVSVAVSLEQGLAQYAAPGDIVSVYSTFRTGQESFTRKILAAVEVLATSANPQSAAQRLTGTSGVGSQLVFVLSVTPREASRLVFAQELGSIWFTLVPEGQQSPRVPDVSYEFLPVR
ncbi:MAG: Flp pilus assembly protein CpaB [Actinomycetota bacterium]